jgi:hypothetical protein
MLMHKLCQRQIALEVELLSVKPNQEREAHVSEKWQYLFVPQRCARWHRRFVTAARHRTRITQPRWDDGDLGFVIELIIGEPSPFPQSPSTLIIPRTTAFMSFGAGCLPDNEHP